MSKNKKAIPKRIAGMKVPKDLRKAGNALIEKAQSPQGREVMVGALAMAATAATAAIARTKTPTPPASEPPAAPPPQGTQSAPDAQAIADALTGAAEQVLGRLFGKRA